MQAGRRAAIAREQKGPNAGKDDDQKNADVEERLHSAMIHCMVSENSE